MNFFKRWFSTPYQQTATVGQNPWAGLASYEDPAGGNSLKFCGRDDESYDVARLAAANIFITLYGKSGIGKTSLLNAGVFPELRKKGFTPLSIRLGLRNQEKLQSYQRVIIDAIEQKLTQITTYDIIDEQSDTQADDYLWNYFARHRFCNTKCEPTIPVVVLDQFEEVFRFNRSEVETLLRQIDYLNDKDHRIDSSTIDGQTYNYEYNFRFVVSIREDDLYRLEDCIDNCYLPALKRSRYRLCSLPDKAAREVILIPGDGLFHDDEKETIVSAIIGKSRNDDNSISTNIISLLCNRIYVDYRRSGFDHITPALVDSFIRDNPFERFYHEATKGLSNREKAYIEENLVDSEGRRNSLPENDLLKRIPNSKRLIEGENRILQRISATNNRSGYRVELLHDSFCTPLTLQKEKRAKARRWKLTIVGLVSILTILLTSIYLINLNQKLFYSHSRILANVANSLVKEGDSYLARLIALRSMDKKYTPEAEFALRNACQYNSFILYERRLVSASPDGKYLLTVNKNYNNYRIYETTSGRCTKEIPCEDDSLFYLSYYNTDGYHIITHSRDSTIRLVDVETGRCLQTLSGHTSRVNRSYLSPDGKIIITNSNDSTTRIWNVNSGQCLRIIDGIHPSAVKISPENKYIALNLPNGSLYIYNIAQDILIKAPTIQVLYQEPELCFSNNNKYLLYKVSDTTIALVDPKTGQILRKLNGHSQRINSVNFDSDGKRIISASFDSTIRIWETTSGECLHILKGHTGKVISAFFGPSEEYVVSAAYDECIKIWDAKSGALLQTLTGPSDFYGLHIQNFSNKQIVTSTGDWTIRVWDIEKRTNIMNLCKNKHRINTASYSPDGSRIISVSNNGTIILWNANNGKCLDTLKLSGVGFPTVCYSPNGQYFASSNYNNIYIWNTNTNQTLDTFEFQSEVHTIAFSNDNKHIISAGHDDKCVYIWSLKTKKCIATLYGHTRGIRSVAYNPNDRLIASASEDKTVRIWDTRLGVCIDSLKGHTSGVTSVAFSPDGKHLASSSYDRTICIWDIATKKITHKLKGHSDYVLSIKYSQNGKYLVSSSTDKTIRIWDASNGKCLHILEGHKKSVRSAAFSPDGRRIVSASTDGTIKIWDFPPLNDLIKETRNRFKDRPLTPEELQQYYLE